MYKVMTLGGDFSTPIGRSVVTSDRARLLRRELGRELATWRKTAGFTQAQLGRKAGYSRSTVSTVESGGQQVPRAFWESCDDLLCTGGALTNHFDRVHQAQIAERRAAAGRLARAADGLTRWPNQAVQPTGPCSLEAYTRIGWPVERGPAGLELVTGIALDALELTRPAGVLAMHWWLGSGGVPDPIRGLPALPPPDEALALIGTDSRTFFLVQSGACPWAAREPVPAPVVDGADAVIRWHSGGSRIPVPPGGNSASTSANWLHAPESFRPTDPVAMLDLLAKAAAAARRHPGALALHDGIVAVPAWSGLHGNDGEYDGGGTLFPSPISVTGPQ